MVHTPDPQLFERPINILVVGCGGNGSAIAAGLPYLHQALLAFGHLGGLNVTLIDPDTVSETNCVRQPFCRTEIGLSKAVVLAHRTNMFWASIGRACRQGSNISRTVLRSTSLSGAWTPAKHDVPSTAGHCAPESSTGSTSATAHPADSSSWDSPTIRRIERRRIACRLSLSCIQRSCQQREKKAIRRRAVPPKLSHDRNGSSPWRVGWQFVCTG